MTEESEIKKRIKALVDARGGFWSAVTGGLYSKPGDPDMVVCYKGRYVGIEAKTPTGVQSKIQKVREDQIRKADGIYILARSEKDVEAVLDRIDEEVSNEEI